MSGTDHANDNGFRIFNDDGPGSVHIHVRYRSGTDPREVAAKLVGAYREACRELEVRLGPIQVDGVDPL